MALVDYLVQRFSYCDRSGWIAEIAAGRLSVAGRLAQPGQRVRRGERVAFLRPHREPWVDPHYVVRYADEHLLVVDKPAHLPCHGDGAFLRHTLIHMLRESFGDGLHLVHRLDRETSGLLAVARTGPARLGLLQQFQAGTIDKSYLAVVQGRVPFSFVATGAIGRCPRSSISLRRAVLSERHPGARPACTVFHIMRAGAASLLRCFPKTGRTHQIRVHLEHAGHPVLGDKLYGRPDREYLAFVERVRRSGDAARASDPSQPGRQLLHASELRLRHPLHGQEMHFDSPLPDDMQPWEPGP